MQAFITVNGRELPCPGRGLSFTESIKIVTATNANGVTVGQKTGNSRRDIHSLEWPHLSAREWSEICKAFYENHNDTDSYVTVTYPDMVENQMVTRKMLAGEFSAQPMTIDEKTGLPTEYVSCRISIADVGSTT